MESWTPVCISWTRLPCPSLTEETPSRWPERPLLWWESIYGCFFPWGIHMMITATAHFKNWNIVVDEWTQGAPHFFMGMPVKDLLFVALSWTPAMMKACWWGTGPATTHTGWHQLPGLVALKSCSATPPARCLSATLSAGSTPPCSTPVRSWSNTSYTYEKPFQICHNAQFPFIPLLREVWMEV